MNFNPIDILRNVFTSRLSSRFFLTAVWILFFNPVIYILPKLKSVLWTLAEFYFNRGLQRTYTGTCIILQKTINGFFCLLIVFLESKTHLLNFKVVIKLNRNLP